MSFFSQDTAFNCTTSWSLALAIILLATGSENRGILGIGSIPVTILPSCKDIKPIALYLHTHEYSWLIKLRNTSEAV